MGAGASARAEDKPSKPIVLKALPAALEHVIYVEEKWPLVVDPTEQASRFLRYQRGSFLIGESARDMDPEHLRQLLVGCLKCGSTFVISHAKPSGYCVERSRRRRGRELDIPSSARGGAAAASWIFRRTLAATPRPRADVRWC